MKDTRGYFNKISSDLDSSLNKNSAVSKSKPNEIEECTNLLQATQSCFRYTALDYVYQVSCHYSLVWNNRAVQIIVQAGK